MDVLKNRGTPKWMVKIMENPMSKWDDLGGFTPLFLETPISSYLRYDLVGLQILGGQHGLISMPSYNQICCPFNPRFEPTALRGRNLTHQKNQ